MSSHLQEAIARLGPSKDATTLVLSHDLRTLLSALQEAREALGPFADEFGEYVPRQDSFALFGNLTLGHFRRAAKVYRALSPGGADE